MSQLNSVSVHTREVEGYRYCVAEPILWLPLRHDHVKVTSTAEERGPRTSAAAANLGRRVTQWRASAVQPNRDYGLDGDDGEKRSLLRSVSARTLGKVG